MSAVPKQSMTVQEFLEWSSGREGKHQLVRGEIFAMAPESIQHARVKLTLVNAMNAAIRRAGLPCEAIIDGPGVAIADDTCYIPDVSVYCGQRADGEGRLVPDPIIAVEVLSPSTERFDSSDKLVDYFTVPRSPSTLCRRRHETSGWPAGLMPSGTTDGFRQSLALLRGPWSA